MGIKNGRIVKANFHSLRILLDYRASSSIILFRHSKKIIKKSPIHSFGEPKEVILTQTKKLMWK